MSRTYEYRSGLASQISAFIAEKRACGCKYEKEAKTFQTLDRFLVEQGINTPVLPELVVEKWIEKRPNEKRKNQKWRLNFTKRFAKYLQLNGYAAYYPELTISSRDDADFSPCIFTSDELARIMKYFETMVPSRQCPTAHLVFPLLFKTLICCGLRAGEATLLRVKDVDLINGVLQIWETKHDKPRYFLCLKVCGRTTNNILKKSMRKVLVTTISSPIPEKAATIQPQSTTGFGMRYGIVELRIKDVDTVRGFMTFVIPLPFVLCKS